MNTIYKRLDYFYISFPRPRHPQQYVTRDHRLFLGPCCQLGKNKLVGTMGGLYQRKLVKTGESVINNCNFAEQYDIFPAMGIIKAKS